MNPWAASHAHRWMRCQRSASNTIHPSVVTDGRGTDANEGDLAHHNLQCRVEGLHAFQVPLPGDIEEAIRFAEPVILERPKSPLFRSMHTEHDIDLTWLHPKLQTARSDYTVWYDDCVEIIDYKNGPGTYVPEDHEELILHGVGEGFAKGYILMDEFDRPEVHPCFQIITTVIQPRYWDDSVEPVRTKVWNADEIELFLNKVQHTIESEELYSYDPGDHCRYCPTVMSCDLAQDALYALTGTNILSSNMKPKLGDYRAMTQMTLDEAMKALQNQKPLGELLKYAQALVEKKAENKDPVVTKHYQRVEQLSSRAKAPSQAMMPTIHDDLIEAGLHPDEFLRETIRPAKEIREALMSHGKTFEEAQAIVDTIYIKGTSVKLIPISEKIEPTHTSGVFDHITV